MFRFEHPDHLFGLLIVPVLVVLYLVFRQLRKRTILKIGNPETVKQMMPGLSSWKENIKFVLVLLGFTFLIVSWANPQWGIKKEKVKRKSIDVVLALDISQSMMAEDIKPSRMERAKKFTQTLIQKLKGERIGLILFAGNAYLQMPLTTDYSAAQLFVKSANTKLAPSQGTAIGDAVDLAEKTFDEENKSHKALIIISDGENHEPNAMEIIQQAGENGLMIFTIGVGTTTPTMIPFERGGRIDYKRDKSGKPVRSALNEEMMISIAENGNGAYFNIAQGSQIIDYLKDRIDKVEKRELEQRVFNEYESYFQLFLIIGIVFLIIEFLISNRRSKVLEGKDIFKV